MKKIIAIASLAMLSACATKPENIQAASVSTLQYEPLTCAQLVAEEQRIDTALVIAYGQQNQARSNDAVGVFLVGLPVASMTGGSVEPQIASLKGQKEAIRQTALKKGC